MTKITVVGWIFSKFDQGFQYEFAIPFPCRLFKDVQIDTFVKLMDSEDLGHMLAQCEVVREFRGSGRALVKATDMCTVEQVQAAVDRSVVYHVISKFIDN